MISRQGSKGFFAAHYDWVALAVGVLALLGGAAFYMTSAGTDADEAAAETVRNVERMKPAKTGVETLDMTPFQRAIKLTRSPQTLSEIAEKSESFLASERRILCTCGKAIVGDPVRVPKCPFCGAEQKAAPKVVLDSDGDGLPDAWEKRYGLNPNDPTDADADADGDEFTNAEEFAAGTDPTDRNDHPDYLDSLSVVLPLKQTYMPFLFVAANKIPNGWRCEFFDPKQKDDYGRLGRKLTAVIGEEIGASGIVLKSYEPKSEKRAIKGSVNKKEVDVSEVVVERKSDGKKLRLVVAASKKDKLAPVDVQATLVYARKGTKNFDVTPGAEIVLSGTKYRVIEIKATAKGAAVTVENVLTGKKRTLEP